MTAKIQSQLQDLFIQQLIQEKLDAVVYLKNGIKLTGKISGHTEEVIFLDSPIPQMVFKNCVSTIMEANSATNRSAS